MPLFTRDILEAISTFRVEVRQVSGRGRFAEHRSRQLGSGIEFKDFRSYQPGDDFRHVDWNLYRRSHRLFLRLFEEVQDLPLYILLDVSDSMFFESPPRADTARLAAGILMAIGLRQMDRGHLYPFGGKLLAPLAGLTGMNGAQKAIHYLERLQAGGETDLGGVIKRFSHLKLRSGLTVVISDFFNPLGIESVIESLSKLRHQLLLIQIIRSTDVSPQLEGEVRIVDCEGGKDVDIYITAQELNAYQKAYAAYFDKLVAFCRKRNIHLLKLDSDKAVLPQIRDLFINGVIRL